MAAGGSVSVAALFMAGVLPGLLLGGGLCAYCLYVARKRNFPKGRVIPMREALRICVEALWGLMTMFIILGGILSGVFTATESASIAVLWAFFVTMFVYRDNRYVILALINVMLLMLGTLMDMAPLILILTPILLPVIKTIGIDPVHFGMIMLVNLGIGLITPPVGAVLFVGTTSAKLRIEEVVQSMWPFFAILFSVLLLVTYVPGISMWLPRLLGL